MTLSTSINYFDSNAHMYMRSVCEDLGMRFVGIHSARMDDLTKKEERQRLHLFAEDFFTSIRARNGVPAAFRRASRASLRTPLPARLARAPRGRAGEKIVILTDAAPGRRASWR